MNGISGNCLVAQSGGPSAVINSSVYGVIEEFLLKQDSYKVYMGLYGIEGIINNKIIDTSRFSKNDIESLRYMPSSALGSCRYKLNNYEDDEEDYKKILNIFKKLDIRYFFYIGGNDSMDAAYKIGKYLEESNYKINVIGVPKTIDNDLIGTDHCPGFGSAAKYLSNVALELWFDINSYEKESVMIIEAMGRDTGWLAASTSLLSNIVPNMNQLIYLPEVAFSKLKFIEDVRKAIKLNNKLLIITAEGLRNNDGAYVNSDDNCYNIDAFGHKQLGGVGKFLQNTLKNSLSNNIKLTDVGVTQRCAMHCISKTDLDEAEMVGRNSVKYAIEGYHNYMTAIKRLNTKEYNCETDIIKLEKVCNKVRKLPIEWINEEKNGVRKDFIKYLSPLIIGEESTIGVDGILKCKNANLFRY